MKIVAISDTHGRHSGIIIPKCDLLICSGDYTGTGEIYEVRSFHKWLEDQPADNIIVSQGNHEVMVEKNFGISKQVALECCPRAIFTEEGPIDILGLKVWCSSVSPRFYDWAYNRDPGPDIEKHWNRIPEGLDILITHCPPLGILDRVVKYNPNTGKQQESSLGCPSLLKRVMEVKPKHHIFGHIHYSYGEETRDGIHFMNAAQLDERYCLVNQPIVFEL